MNYGEKKARVLKSYYLITSSDIGLLYFVEQLHGCYKTLDMAADLTVFTLRSHQTAHCPSS